MFINTSVMYEVLPLAMANHLCFGVERLVSSMIKSWILWFSFFLFAVFINASTMSMQRRVTNEERQEYIVYMGSKPEGKHSLSSQHYSMLRDVMEDSHVEDSIVRSYKRSFNGFAAKLTEKQRQTLASKNEVVSVFPSTTLHLHTTRSWDFLGFPENVKRRHTIESDTIIGVIDTGIWPESKSFSDKGFGPPPKKWKGDCDGGQNFTCNNKIIGARNYLSSSGDFSARDTNGHGTHTAATAAGNIVRNASFFGFAKGNARGGVPSARIAVYKACAGRDCKSEDILAAFDDAISDGVDIISISLGPDDPVNWTGDPIAIGAFHAMEKNILTVQSAGNAGLAFFKTGSTAPWILTVAATNMDRRIINKVVLGNGMTLSGSTINTYQLKGSAFPLMYAVKSWCGPTFSRRCMLGCIRNGPKVKKKIILCDDYSGIVEAERVKAIGVIAAKLVENDASFNVPLPTTALLPNDYAKVLSYFNSTKSPHANILKSEDVKIHDAPVVLSFSSRGPNRVVPDIVKPDISAPGVEILAAFSPLGSPMDDSNWDNRSVEYSIMSGTSMACPHVAAAAAYVKTFHPHWSASAIKSALMTTASPMNEADVDGTQIFASGAGNLNPVGALEPGLVYETSKEDYIKMLCGMGIDEQSLTRISGGNAGCHNYSNALLPKDLNYPIMTAQVPEGRPFNVQFKRTVTNVGRPNSTYVLKVQRRSGVNVTAKPSILSFKSLNEKQSFIVTVTGRRPIAHSQLEWSDGTHKVRSRIVVF